MLVPLLEAEGIYSELEIYELSMYVEKIVYLVSDDPLRNNVTERLYCKKHYRLHKLKFKVDSKREAKVFVYVDVDYKPISFNFTIEDRDRVIQEDLKEDSAWLFTYGQREQL